MSQRHYICTTPRRSTRSATRSRRSAKAAKHNRAKVGSGRPSGAAVHLRPRGDHGPSPVHDHADRARRLGPDLASPRRRPAADPRAPAARGRCRLHLRSRTQLRPHPWQPKRLSFSTEGNDLGVPARVFPQWLRCTGCDFLGLLSQFHYTNTHPFRTDLASFEHAKCSGRGGSGPRKAARPPRGAGPVPAGLRGRAPGRVPVRAMGPPRPEVRQGRSPDAADDRPDGGQGRVGDDQMRLVRAAAADERGPGRGGRGQAAASAGAATRTWTRSSPAAAAPTPS